MDKTQVRTAADLEKKYNFSKILGLGVNIENARKELIKMENELANMLNSLIINLGDLLDTQSSISLWFYDETPTTSNEPYISWNDPSEHYGDFYYDRHTGYVYKFTSNGWEQQFDTNLINAMALTNVELDVENDHERKVFFDTPTPPYQSGDWWILEDGTLMICQITKTTGEYINYDFITSSLYTANLATIIDSVKVGNDEVIAKINMSPEQITIDANKIGLTANDVLDIISGNSINLTSKNITIDSTNFSVDANGNVTMNSADVTGGSIKLQGANREDNSKFSVYRSIDGIDYEASIAPGEMRIDTNNSSAIMWNYDFDTSFRVQFNSILSQPNNCAIIGMGGFNYQTPGSACSVSFGMATSQCNGIWVAGQDFIYQELSGPNGSVKITDNDIEFSNNQGTFTCTKLNGGATIESAKYYRFGKVITVYIVFTVQTATNAGNNAWEGTVTDLPLPAGGVVTATAFIGNQVYSLNIDTAGNMIIRALTTTLLVNSNDHNISATYIIDN